MNIDKTNINKIKKKNIANCNKM